MEHFDLTDWNPVALEVIQMMWIPVYDTSRLTTGTGMRAGPSKKAHTERRRRQGIRRLSEELSRYYPLPANQSAWGCPELLSKGKHGVITRRHDAPFTCVLFLVLGDVEGLLNPSAAPSA